MGLLGYLGDFMFPRVCHVCGGSLSRTERYICLPCLSRLPRTLYHRRPDNPMERRFAGVIPFEQATGHFFYSRGSDVARLIHDCKYRGFRGLARHLGSLVGNELLITGFLSDIDAIVPVPMHFVKQAKRGYNQVDEIAVGLSAATGITVDPILHAVRGHQSQTTYTLKERSKNIDGVFMRKPGARVNGRHLLLIDDVCTTGSTLISAAEALIKDADITGPNAIRLSLLTIGVTF